MTGLKSRSFLALLTVLALGGIPALAGAQDSAPTREGNTWDWRHHEPNPSVVHRDERAAGVDPSAAQQKKATDNVESLYSQIMKDAEDR
jgi:hypothetical protein